MKYRKRPVIVEAIQWTGDNFDEIYAWGNPEGQTLTAKIVMEGMGWEIGKEKPGRLAIETLEGDMKAEVGDWIIRGIKGELYPCKPDIFAATYEPVREEEPAALPHEWVWYIGDKFQTCKHCEVIHGTANDSDPCPARNAKPLLHEHRH